MKMPLLLCALVVAAVSQAQAYSYGLVPSTTAHANSSIAAARIAAQSTITIPASWDWRWYGVVTPSKDQGACGACWAFASTAMMESKIAMAGGNVQDLSEQRMITDLQPTNGCTGGNSLQAGLGYWTSHLASWESCAPYYQWNGATYNTACPTAFTNSMKDNGAYIGLPIQGSSFPSSIQASIYADGPAVLGIRAYQDFQDFWTNNSNSGKVYKNNTSLDPMGANGVRTPAYHAITAIGWDDVKQAFLCKNSWDGANGGPNSDGTFWIAYSGHQNTIFTEAANFVLAGSTFENTAYTYINRDVAAAFGGTSVGKNNGHWKNYGVGEGRFGSTSFSSFYYTALNPDLVNYSNAAATEHWVSHGSTEGRRASPVFDPQYYLNAYADLTNYYTNAQAMTHWNLYGINEGRRGSREFDSQYYLNNNPDVAAAYSNSYLGAMDHWLGHGLNEGRQSAADFSIKAYVNRYPDLKAGFGTNYRLALIHWIKYGKNEGRNPAP